MKISHPFFTELVDQATQYILSGDDGIIRSDIPELQTELDAYFNENEDFTSELSEVITDCQVKGFAFMHSFKNEENRIDLGKMHIDNIAPECEVPEEFKSWKYFLLWS